MGEKSDDHPLFGLVGLLERDEAERVREEAAALRDDLEREV